MELPIPKGFKPGAKFSNNNEEQFVTEQMKKAGHKVTITNEHTFEMKMIDLLVKQQKSDLDDLYIATSPINFMKKDKGPQFTLMNLPSPIERTESKTTICITPTITDRSGNIGEVYKEGESWMVRITESKLPDDKKKLQLAKRMQAWYYNTQVKK